MSIEDKTGPPSPKSAGKSEKTKTTPLSTHLPRRHKSSQHSNGVTPHLSPGGSASVTLPRRRRKRCVRNTSLPTIIEDDAAISPTRSSSTSESTSTDTSHEPSTPTKTGDVLLSRPCQAVTSMSERRPTRSTQRQRHPNECAGVTAIDADQMLLSSKRPFLIYDLLPPQCKNPSYMLRVDLDIPRPRFILTHRTCYKRFGILPAADKAELVRAAFDFAAAFELPDCVLVVPLGSNNKCDTLYNTFYAYILVPKVANFIKVFDRLKTQIPLWPSVRWITPFWDIDMNEPSVEKNFLRTVRGYHRQWSDIETPLTEFKGCVAKVGRRVSFYGSNQINATLSDYDVAVCEKTGRVGLVFPDSSYEKCPVNRWHLLETMFARVKEHVADQRRGCYMLLSLAERFLIGQGHKTYSIIHFEKGIPDSLSFQDTLDSKQS